MWGAEGEKAKGEERTYCGLACATLFSASAGLCCGVLP